MEGLSLVILKVIVEYGPIVAVFICIISMSNCIRRIDKNLEEIKNEVEVGKQIVFLSKNLKVIEKEINQIKMEISDSEVSCPHCNTAISKRDLRAIQSGNKKSYLCMNCGNEVEFN